MLAASMEAPSYGASRLPFTIRHRPTLYVTKFASCGWVSISWRQRGGRGDPDPAPEMIEWDAVCWVKSRHRSASAQCPLYPQKRTLIEASRDVRFCQKRTSRRLFDDRVGFTLGPVAWKRELKDRSTGATRRGPQTPAM